MLLQRGQCLQHRRFLRHRTVQVFNAVKTRNLKNICCSKTLVSRQENVEQVLKLCKEITAFSQKQMAEKKNGILVFDCVRDGWEDNTFHFWERYDSHASLGKHNTTAEVQSFMVRVVPYLEKPVGLAMYEYQDGKLGCCGIQAGPKGEGGLDDATGASGAAGGAGLKQTSFTLDMTKVREAEDDFMQDALKGLTSKLPLKLGSVFRNIFAAASKK